MSRVNEALRRAGHGDEEPSGPIESGDTQFVTGEESIDSPVLEPEPEPEPIHAEFDRSGKARSLVPRNRTVDMVRHEHRNEVQLVDIMRILHDGWKTIAIVVGAGLGLALAYNFLATPIYEARARVLVEPDSAAVVPFQTVAEDTGRFDYFTTQLEVLRSRPLAVKTMERLKLARVPGELEVAPTRSDLGPSRVVNLTFTSPDPQLAARFVNTLAETYVDQNLELRRKGSQDASKWLDERLGELRKEVTSTQGALQQYREQRNSVSLGDQQNIVVQKLAQLNANVTTVRAERLAQEALYEQLSSAQASGAALDTLPAISSNSFIQGVKAELATLQRERAQLAERLGELHPDMIKVDTAIAVASGRLKAETDKVVASITNDFKAAQARERGLVAALESQKREVLELSEQSIGYNALQRDAASTQQILESVLQRLKETELSGELQSNNVRILDTSDVPRTSIWPRVWVNLFLALFGGTFVGICFVLGLEYLNPRITKPSDVSDALGLPLLGVTPKVGALEKGRSVVGGLPPEFQDALRGIRTRILLSPMAANGGTLAVTSTAPGEGKTVIATSLAISMATAGRRVLLVDADMHRPQLHNVFSVKAHPGLANIMAGQAKPSETLLKSVVTGLFLLPAGANVEAPSDVLDSQRLSALIEGFRKVFDVVIMDCPPVMALSDASVIAHAASSVLFVVGAGSCNREGARAAIDRLTSVQAQMIGVVLNNAKRDYQSSYYYPYYSRTEIA